jgi:hypothetical protein
VPPQPGFFLELWTLDAGALLGEGRYATLRITAEAGDGSHRAVAAAVEQFDLQPLTTSVLGFGPGWHEQEYSPAAGRLWRWTSDAAMLRIGGAVGDLRIEIAGESPLRYFDAPPEVTLAAGELVLARASPTTDFTLTADVPAASLRNAGGVLTLRTSRVFVPAEVSGTGDRRRLGLRVYDVRVRPVGG